MIDDLFGEPRSKELSSTSNRIGFDHVRSEVFPFDVKEYSKIIIFNESSPAVSEFSRSKFNILNTDSFNLDKIDPNLFVYDKRQIQNLLDDLYRQCIRDEEFIAKFFSPQDGIVSLNPDFLDSLSAVDNALFLHNVFTTGVKQNAFEYTREDLLLRDRNVANLTNIKLGLDMAKAFLDDNLDVILRRLV